MQKIIKQFPEANLCFVGPIKDIKTFNFLTENIDSLGLRENIVFKGKCSFWVGDLYGNHTLPVFREWEQAGGNVSTSFDDQIAEAKAKMGKRKVTKRKAKSEKRKAKSEMSSFRGTKSEK